MLILNWITVLDSSKTYWFLVINDTFSGQKYISKTKLKQNGKIYVTLVFDKNELCFYVKVKIYFEHTQYL